MTAEYIIRWSTAGAVLGVAAVAAVASYEHAYDLVRAHGESVGWPAWSRSRWTANLREFDAMVMLDSARRKTLVPGSLDPCHPCSTPCRPATCAASAGLPFRRVGRLGHELSAWRDDAGARQLAWVRRHVLMTRLHLRLVCDQTAAINCRSALRAGARSIGVIKVSEDPAMVAGR